MRNKIKKLLTGIIVVSLIASFSLAPLSMRGISTSPEDISFSVSTSSTQDTFWPGNSSEWTEVAPETQGLNSSKIAEMFEFIKDNRQDVHSIIVVRNGHLLVYEYLHHFEIYTDIFGTKTYFGGDNLHGQYSGTKSFISILIGIALQEGLLDNISQTLYEFFAHKWSPSFINSTVKKNITIEQLLTMNSGLTDPPSIDHETQDDVIMLTLDKVPLTFTPGEEGEFEYTNFGVDLLSGIIANVSGTSTEEFAKQYLFEPLGISEDEYYWLNDSIGMDYGGSGIECTPKVQAKIGMLALNNGTWNGEQIVDKDFMKDATTFRPDFITFDNGTESYGYLWWTMNGSLQGYYAAGALGQTIYVLPEYNIVVGFTGYYADVYEQIILDYILQFVELPETGPNNPGIPGFDFNMIVLMIFGTSAVIIIRMKKYYNKKKR